MFRSKMCFLISTPPALPRRNQFSDGGVPLCMHLRVYVRVGARVFVHSYGSLPMCKMTPLG
uniref:Uncharacterized protein n=1 Tax=Anguilla anguilla TaxID=7936 RepID=A0A0E9RMA9_ANGAN